MSLNKVILIGNVGKDPDVRYFDSGAAVANFPLATGEVEPGQGNLLERINLQGWFSWKYLIYHPG